MDTDHRDRILIIGPVLPYRGGIAQHTTMLHRTLNKHVDCLTISFNRQYPKWIFPGGSDKELALSEHIEKNVEYLIDSLNPLSWARAVKRAKKFSPRIALFPWWHAYWTPCFTWISKRLKKFGVEIVILCHNTVEHEDRIVKRILARNFLANADRFITQTSFDRQNLFENFPNIPVAVHAHPIYHQFPLPNVKLPRRAKLELLFFGLVRPYKGLSTLLAAMSQLKNEEVFLSVVGEFWDDINKTLKYITEAGLNKKVEIVARYVSDQEAAAYFARCDVVVLPYHSATGSGVVSLAYHYGKPVIATRVGGLPDVVIDGKTGRLITPGSISELTETIKAAISNRDFFNMEEITLMKSNLTWEGMAKIILAKN